VSNKQEPKQKLETATKIANKTKNVKSVYESLEEIVFRFFRWTSSIVDRVFFSKKYLGVFALLLACMSYFVVTYDSSNSTALSSSKTLSNVSINPRYNSETFELSGVPSSCEVIITGEAANVTNAASKKGYCQLNLEGYTEGTHTVKMSAVGYGDNVSTAVSPSEVTITLNKKTTMQFDLSYDYINQNDMDSRYILSEPTFESGSKINIRASSDTLKSIVMVKALIDVSGQTGDFSIEAPLVAYNKNGQAVNAEIVPSSVKASVSISSPNKQVGVKLNVIGVAPDGYAIDTVSMDHESIVIFAPQNVLDKIEEVYVDFDLSNVTGTKEIMLPITLPSGVSTSDVSMINLSVNLTAVETKVIESLPIEYIDNDNNLAVSDVSVKRVDVIVSGSQNNIEDITKDDVVVYFSMAGLEPGEYTIPLQFACDSNPYVKLSSDIKEIKITLVEAGD